MKYTIYSDVDGNLHRLNHAKPGPKSKGYVKVLVNIPPEHLELMKWENEKCGGLNPVGEQIRQAIRAQLCGLVYISLLKH